MMIKSLVIFCVLSAAVYAQDRKISSVLNPGLDDNSTDITLVHVKADSFSDSVHQIWDFTQGIPTMIFAITDLNATVDVTWQNERPTKIVLSEKPVYSFAAVIDKLYEYDDIAENGAITEDTPRKEYELRAVRWNRTRTLLTNNEAYIEVEAKGFKAHRLWRSGVITMKLDLLPYKDYATELPHLIHTANSTLVDIKLVNLTTSREYNASRFAYHMIVASTDHFTDTLHFYMRKSLDDEHTPGVFEIIEIKTPESYKQDDGGFIQFRPVGYTSKERSVTTSTNAHVSHFNRTELPLDSTVKTYFKSFGKGLVQDMVVSFGESGDGCYRQTNYTAWSFTIGYGAPPLEGFSLFVILVISIGLGVPVVLALSGITYVFVRKCKQRNVPTRLQDED